VSFEQTPFIKHFATEKGRMFSEVVPAPLEAPQILLVSPLSKQFPELANLDWSQSEHAQFWSGGTTKTYLGTPLPTPSAQVYSGHQFGHWAGQLGDGRAITIGSLNDNSGALWEFQLKGAGITPYSRMGDGRAVLRSSIREFLCSEAMHALGVPTTRALTLAGSMTAVIRETVETGAVVSRIAPSFIRFGHFEHFYYTQQTEQLAALTQFVLRQFYPHLLNEPNPAAALLREVTLRTAQLVAQWQGLGFCHGVLNTDNMSILGLTLDYGPFGFMEAFEPGYICNHTDQGGRYAYNNQPGIGQWNCYALGQTLVAQIGSADETTSVLSEFKPVYEQAMRLIWRQKLGLSDHVDPQIGSHDPELIDTMFQLLESNHCDWTTWFRALCDFNENQENAASNQVLVNLCIDRMACSQWLNQYRQRLLSQQTQVSQIDRQLKMKQTNPKYVLRNYLAQQVIDAAQKLDVEPLKKLMAVLSKPFDDQPENNKFAALPPEWARHLEVSCSS
jgi:serine/tyrosine/threonine adenylyltransferase